MDGEDVWLDHHGVSIGMTDTVEQLTAALDDAMSLAFSPDIRRRLSLRKVSSGTS